MQDKDTALTAMTARRLISSTSAQRVSGTHRPRGGDFGSGSLVGSRANPGDRAAAVTPQGGAERGAGWRQQQLVLKQERARDRGDRPTESVRQAGLVGIAQAREALAEAVRRAKSRAETKAA